MVSLTPDVAVLAFVTYRARRIAIRFPKLGSISHHPSLLPKYRGASAINWAIINGETKTGVTIFWVDAGIDTGDILLQKEVEIPAGETTGELYLNKLYPLGVEAVLEAVGLIARGEAPRIPQDHTRGTYDPPCDEKVARIDWNKPGHQVFNFIRGTDPQPGATAFFRGEKVKVYNARFIEEHHQAAPGEVLEINPDLGVFVAVRGGRCASPVSAPRTWVK